MRPIPLTSGDYRAASVIANQQRRLNLYMELNPENTKPPMPATHYQRPGKTILSSPPQAGASRGLYRATDGNLYAVVGTTVYFIDNNWVFNPLGNIDPGVSIASMADNGQKAGDLIALVDSTSKGYQIVMTTQVMTQIVDGTGTFIGSNIALYLETFFLFNQPGTQNWYISQPDALTFDPLDVATKAGYADNINSIGVRQQEVWLVGELSTEPWYLSGAQDFPFEKIASTFVSYGCVAVYSLVFADIHLFWVSRNTQGQRIILMTEGYEAKAVSTRALEAELQTYADVSDCVGSAFQLNGHTFVVFTFPTADKTWVMDLTTKEWFPWAWTDRDGNLHRDRVMLYALAYDTVVGLDWENGTLYKIDTTAYTDDGDPISYVCGFSHVLSMMNRMTHWALTVDMECGTLQDPNADEPLLGLRYSDDRGKTFFEAPAIGLGGVGEYGVSPQFTQLGTARDRVYELWWSASVKTAINGIYLQADADDTADDGV